MKRGSTNSQCAAHNYNRYCKPLVRNIGGGRAICKKMDRDANAREKVCALAPQVNKTESFVCVVCKLVVRRVRVRCERDVPLSPARSE